MKKFTIGDIHGRLKAFKQVLERSGFDMQNDMLIDLGDIMDYGEDTFGCIDLLMSIPNKVLIQGNHDSSFMEYAKTGYNGLTGHSGVNVSMDKWRELSGEEKTRYMHFFESQIYYHLDDNRCFVHGGFEREHLIDNQPPLMLMWDRSLWQKAMSCSGEQKLKTCDDFREIFIGHTPTLIWDENVPMYRGGIWNMDTGAKVDIGKLSMMNIDTHEIFQSDFIKDII